MLGKTLSFIHPMHFVSIWTTKFELVNHCNKMVRLLAFLVLTCLNSSIWGQIKIGDNPSIINPSSSVELESSDKGIVLPRVTLNDASTPAPLSVGLAMGTTIFNLNGTEPTGFYIWDGSKWVLQNDAEPWRDMSTGKEAKNSQTTHTYYNMGNVGIGNLTPNDPLDVLGNTQLNGPLYIGGKTSSGENGLKLHTDQTNNYIDSKIPLTGFTLFRADNTNGITNRLAIDNGNGFFGVNYNSGGLIAQLDVNGNIHVRSGGNFSSNIGLHMMVEVLTPNSSTVELVSDHQSNTLGKGGFTYYTTLLNVPNQILSLDSAGILGLTQYGLGNFHFDSSLTSPADLQYLIGIQSDGDLVESPNLKHSFFEGDIGGFSILSAFPVTVDASETTDAGGNFDPTTSIYTAPYDGLYLLKLNGFATALASIEVKIKIGTDNSEDGTEFYIPLQSSVSASIESTQVISFDKGDQIQVFVETGLGTQFSISRGYWSIICLQPF